MTTFYRSNPVHFLTLFTWFVAVLCFESFGQVAYRQVLPRHINTINAEVEPEPVIGSPYVDNNFVLGTVYNANRSPNEAYIRYNAYQDYVEFQLDRAFFALDPAPDIIKVDFGDYTMVVGEFKERDEWKNGYFVLLDSGKMSLFKRVQINYDNEEELDEFGTKDFTPEFKRLPDRFYFKIAGQERLTKIKKLKLMVESIPNYQKKLTTYIKTNKISPRKEDQLLALVQFYNSLQ